MDIPSEVHALVPKVTELEQGLQSLAFNIVRQAGNYDLSEQLLQVARDLHAIGNRVEAIANIGRQTDVGNLPRPPLGKSRGSRAYPVFAVAGDRVVKVGKGKSRSAQEYRHEAPKEAFLRLLAWLDETRASGRDEWLAKDVIDALSGDVPSYQVYLMLGALSASGLLTLVSKGRYKEASQDLPTSTYWSALRANLDSEKPE